MPGTQQNPEPDNRAARRGSDLIMAPDVQGARTVRRLLPNAITIFLRPPSLEELFMRHYSTNGARNAKEVAAR